MSDETNENDVVAFEPEEVTKFIFIGLDPETGEPRYDTDGLHHYEIIGALRVVLALAEEEALGVYEADEDAE